MQRQTLELFWRAAMRYPVRTTLTIVTTCSLIIVSAVIAPLIISRLLEDLQAGKLTLAGSSSLLILYIATQAYGEVIGWRIVLYTVWTMQIKAERALFNRVFSHLSSQSMRFHADRFGGALVSQTSKLSGAFERFWDTITFMLLPSLTGIIATIVVMWFVFWQYALLLLVVSVIFTAIVIFGSRFLARRNKEEAQASTAITAHVADSVTNIMTVKSYGNEEPERQELDTRTAKWQDKSFATMRGFLIVSTAYSGLLAAMNVSALIAAIWASENRLISIGTVYLCVTYTFTVARYLWEMNTITRNYNRIMGDAHDMVEILQLPPTVTDTSTDTLKMSGGRVKFDNVGFSHVGSGEPLFSRFSLEIKGGERLGLVGPSGSGKTTVTNLLLRFYDVDEGAVLIDGQNIQSITQESLRKAIAYVPQEPLLFHRSLRENIAYGKPDASIDEVREAARQANALEFIDSLPLGFETEVGERGVKLSGGQRQRVAIARAILKDAPILVLDEATSALDSESERLIQDALTKLMKGRTSLVIAHRLSTISSLDRIVVLDKGSIAEEGTHRELLVKNGIYAKLWARQSGGFIEE